MTRRTLSLVLMTLAITAFAGALLAGGVSAKRGIVEKVSADGKTVTVKFTHTEETTELSVGDKIDVLLDGKHVALEAIKPGMSVTVQVDGKVAERIIAHAASGAEPKTPQTTKSPKPKSTVKTTTTRKSKQIVRKSNKSGSKRNGPSARRNADCDDSFSRFVKLAQREEEPTQRTRRSPGCIHSSGPSESFQRTGQPTQRPRLDASGNDPFGRNEEPLNVSDARPQHVDPAADE